MTRAIAFAAAALGGATAALIVWTGRDLLWTAQLQDLIARTTATLDDRKPAK